MDSATLDHVLIIAGAVVPLLSALASLLNHIIRKQTEAKKPVSPFLSGVGVVTNLVAVNLDKALQLARVARGGPYVPEPSAPLPATTFVPPTASPVVSPDVKP